MDWEETGFGRVMLGCLVCVENCWSAEVLGIVLGACQLDVGGRVAENRAQEGVNGGLQLRYAAHRRAGVQSSRILQRQRATMTSSTPNGPEMLTAGQVHDLTGVRFWSPQGPPPSSDAVGREKEQIDQPRRDLA
jgi:hypothetical protein